MNLNNKGLVTVLILSSGIILYLIYNFIVRIIHREKRRKPKSLNEAVTRFLVSHRIALSHYIYFGAAFFIIIFGELKLKSVLIGLGISIVGTIIRVWAYSYKMTDEKLIKYGPYGLVMHPRYLGNFIIAIGVVWLSSKILLVFLVTLCFFILYYAKIRDEERNLIKIFGEEYVKYKRDVATIIPIKNIIFLLKTKFMPIRTKVDEKYRVSNKIELLLNGIYCIVLNLFVIFLLYLKCYVIPSLLS